MATQRRRGRGEECEGEEWDGEELRRRLEAEAAGDSVWTVDVMFVLHARGLRLRLVSTTLGVSPQTRALPYYSCVVQADEARVRRRFAALRAAGVPMHQQALPEASLARLLATPTSPPSFVLVLLDSRYIRCAHCDAHASSSKRTSPPSFAGHYVVLVAFHAPSRAFLYCDPARPAGESCARAGDVCRRCQAT